MLSIGYEQHQKVNNIYLTIKPRKQTNEDMSTRKEKKNEAIQNSYNRPDYIKSNSLHCKEGNAEAVESYSKPIIKEIIGSLDDDTSGYLINGIETIDETKYQLHLEGYLEVSPTKADVIDSSDEFKNFENNIKTLNSSSDSYLHIQFPNSEEYINQSSHITPQNIDSLEKHTIEKIKYLNLQANENTL